MSEHAMNLTCSFCAREATSEHLYLARKDSARICTRCALRIVELATSAKGLPTLINALDCVLVEEEHGSYMGFERSYFVRASIPGDTIPECNRGSTCGFSIGADNGKEAILRVRALGGLLAMAPILPVGLRSSEESAK